MNIINTTKVRNNWADVMKRVAREKYLIVNRRGKMKWAIVDYEFLKNLLKGKDDNTLADLEKMKSEFEETYK